MADNGVMVATISVYRDGELVAEIRSCTEKHDNYISVRNALRTIPGVDRQVIQHSHRMAEYVLVKDGLFEFWQKL